MKTMKDVHRWQSYKFKCKYDKLIDECTESIKSDPHRVAAYRYRADAYVEKDELDSAIADYNKALELSPTYTAAYKRRGDFYCKHKREYENAISDYSKVIELETDEQKKVTVYKNRGFAYERHGDYDLAISDYTNAILLSPNDPVAYNSRGYIYAQKGNYRQAIMDHNKAIELSPNYVVAYKNLGFVYSSTGEFDSAIKALNTAICLDPNYAMAYSTRGFTYSAMDNFDQAIIDLSTAIDLDPEYPKAYRNRGYAYARLNKFDEAFGDHCKDIHYSSDDRNFASAYNAKGLTHFLKGNYEKALKDYKIAIAYKSNLSRIYLNVGDLFHANHKDEKAIENYDNAVLYSPNHKMGLVDRNFAHNAGNAITNARKLLKDKIKHLPEGTDEHFYYKGLIAVLRNDTTSAETWFNESLKEADSDLKKRITQHLKNIKDKKSY